MVPTPQEYRGALGRHDRRAFFPADASVQPGQLQEVMLHETAVSWMRDSLAKTLPKRSACDVDGLCRELPSRVKDLDRRQGDRLAKWCGSLKNSACPI